MSLDGGGLSWKPSSSLELKENWHLNQKAVPGKIGRQSSLYSQPFCSAALPSIGFMVRSH